MPSSKGYVDLETGAAGGSNKDLTMEAFGTLLISLALFGSGDWRCCLASGAMLALITGFAGGGHYNPIVTVATTVKAKSDIMAATKTILAQIAGATVAAIFLGFFGDGADIASDFDQTAAINEALLVFMLVLTYLATSDGLRLGLAYFSALSAFPTVGGGNPAATLGGILGNIVAGGSLDVSAGPLSHVLVPLAVAAATPLLKPFLDKAGPLAIELLGTFYLATMIGALSGLDSSGATIAIGTSLCTWHIIGGMDRAYNPSVAVAKFVKSRDLSTIADPLFAIAAQIGGATLAAIASATLGTGGGIGASDDLTVDLTSVIAVVAAAAFFSTYFLKADALTTGLAYFAILAAFGGYGSSLNPALPAGALVASVAGFGSGGVSLNGMVAPLVGGAVAALAIGQMATLVHEGLGTFLLVLALTNGTTDSLLPIGLLLMILLTVDSRAHYNPVVTLSSVARNGTSRYEAPKIIGAQIAGALVAALLAFSAGGADGAAYSDGISGGKSPVGELFIAIFLGGIVTAGADPLSTGITYYAALAAFGAAAGSIANPAITAGYWIANGLLGGGFDFSADALVSLLSHFTAPLVGGFVAHTLIAAFHKDSLGLSKLGLPASEILASFLVVLGFAGASSDLESALVLGAVVALCGGCHIFPTIAAAGLSKPSAATAKSFGMTLVAHLLGAIGALLVAGWLVGAPDTNADGDLTTASLNLLLFGAVLVIGFQSTNVALTLALIYFAGATVFGGNVNPASALASWLVDGLTGGGFAVDSSLAVAIFAPVVGGAFGGFVSGFLK